MPNELRGIYSSPVATADIVYAFGGQTLYAVDPDSGEIHWELSVAERGSRTEITGSPALADPYLFFAHSNGMLKAVDVNRREVVWRFDLKTRIDSSPAISGNALYITGRDGAIYAFVASP